MPLYEYQCRPHGHRFEVRHGMNEDPVKICPECGGEVRRVIHPVGVVFKGSGFYVTDSRKSGPTSKPAETSSKSETSSDKPATAPSSESSKKSDSAAE